MPLSSMWGSPYVQSGLRFVRRNSGKIALFTVVTGSAVAAATYMRRQMRAVNESIEEERTIGARKLRAVFIANSHTVRSAFRALLPIAKDILSGTDRVNALQYITKLREKPLDRQEKEELWDKVKVASVTHLLSATYIAAVLYSALALQMNLLARYTNSSMEAPVQSLPSGTLSAVTSKTFLDLARKNLLDRKRVDVITKRIEELVKIQVQDTGLSERMGHIDVECLCAGILGTIETDAPMDENEREEETGEKPAEDNLSSPQHWLFRYEERVSDAAGSVARDGNYDWLVQESLDLCEILDFSGVVFSNASSVLSYALADFRDEMMRSEAQLPFAHILPRFDGMVQRVFPGGKQEDENGIPMPSDTELDGILSGGDDSARFAASVFLSGEKENNRQHRQHRDLAQMQEGGNADRQNGEATENVVTNVSATGGRDSDDLGLMFDVR